MPPEINVSQLKLWACENFPQKHFYIKSASVTRLERTVELFAHTTLLLFRISSAQQTPPQMCTMDAILSPSSIIRSKANANRKQISNDLYYTNAHVCLLCSTHKTSCSHDCCVRWKFCPPFGRSFVRSSMGFRDQTPTALMMTTPTSQIKSCTTLYCNSTHQLYNTIYSRSRTLAHIPRLDLSPSAI